MYHLILGFLAPSKDTGLVTSKLLMQVSCTAFWKDLLHQLDKEPWFLIWLVQIIPLFVFLLVHSEFSIEIELGN